MTSLGRFQISEKPCATEAIFRFLVFPFFSILGEYTSERTDKQCDQTNSGVESGVSRIKYVMMSRARIFMR
jgi:hypothetical protein